MRRLVSLVPLLPGAILLASCASAPVAAEPDTLDYCTSDSPIPGAQSP